MTRRLADPPRASPPSYRDRPRNIDPEWSCRRSRRPEWPPSAVAGCRPSKSSIHDVVGKLDLALPSSSPTVASSSVAQARARLDPDPMEWLFTICAEHWAHASARSHHWRGLALYGVDGTTLRVPDSTDNAGFFGYSHSVRGQSAYPMVRGVGLMALRSHLLAAVAFGPYAAGEISYATNLWSSLPRDSLTIVDRGFCSAKILIPLARGGTNRHWLIRAKSNLRWRVLRRLGPRDAIVEMTVSRGARKQDPSLPERWVALPADEIAALYHERWRWSSATTRSRRSCSTARKRSGAEPQPESNRSCGGSSSRPTSCASRSIERVATEAGVEPTRISFVAALRLIGDEWLWCALASPGAIPNHLRNLRASLKTLILPPRRSERRFPRAVKIKMSNYARKRRKGSK